MQHPDAIPAILAEADACVQGFVSVPGFGKRSLHWEMSETASEVDQYAFRLFSRLDFLRPLLRADLVSEPNSVFREKIEAVLREFRDVRRQQQGWDTVDDAIRILNIIEVLAILRHRLKSSAVQAGLETICTAAWNVESNRGRIGNHLVYEGLALFLVGTCLPSLPRAAAWRLQGIRILEQEINRQVLDDGMHAELCTNYHLIAATNFLKALVLDEHGGSSLSKSYRSKVAAMLKIAHLLRAADGGFIALGDSDRMAGNSREEREARAFSEWGAIADNKSKECVWNLEMAWLVAGNKDVKRINELTEIQNTRVHYGGYYFLQNSDSDRLVFDAGGFGLPGASHHGHADHLAFEFHCRGVRFLVDPGGFSYVDQRAREFARSTAAHNALKLDQRDSSEVFDLFGFGRTAKVRMLHSHIESRFVILVAEQEGYQRLRLPVVQQRALVWSRHTPFLLLVHDRIIGRGEHRVEAFFHGDSGWKAALDGAG
ncbi:MAG: alginate lyase family protein, partial [bacterium]